MSSLKPGRRIPALLSVHPADVPLGAQIWGYQELGSLDAVLLAFPVKASHVHVDKDGGLVYLGVRFGDADADALILIEQA